MSKFAFAVASPKVKGDVSTTPELTVTVTKDKIRLNSAFCRKLLVKHGDRLMFVTNEDSVIDAVAAGELTEEQAQEHIVYAIAKGVPKLDANGKANMIRKRLTNADKEALDAGTYDGQVDEEGMPIEMEFNGFKLASNSQSTGYGILEGSDAGQYATLKGNADKHRVYGLGEEIEVPVNGETVKGYAIEFIREEEKVERKSSKKVSDDTTSDEAEQTSAELED